MADGGDDSTALPSRKTRGRRKRDMAPWLQAMAKFRLLHPEWSVLRLAGAVVEITKDGHGPCASRGALLALLRERWRDEGERWTEAERRRQQAEQRPMTIADAVAEWNRSARLSKSVLRQFDVLRDFNEQTKLLKSILSLAIISPRR